MTKYLFLLILNVSVQYLGAQVTDTIFVELSGVKLHTVLTKPSGTTSTPLAIIIAGSGPTDLNGNQPMMQNNSLRLLSDGLVSQNIATLRFDKRAIAKSAVANFKEEELTIDIFANDVVHLIEFARNKGYSKIFIIGHSEGSLIGLIAMQKTAISGFVSLAGAGSAADVILKNQLKPQLPPALYQQTELIIDSLKNGYRVNSFPPMLFSLFRPSVQPYLISWFKYNPSTLISRIKCPVLIAQGDKDIQIKPEDAQQLAAAQPAAKLLIIHKMNHVLKNIEGDMQENIAAYTNPGLPINKELVAGIADFIRKN